MDFTTFVQLLHPIIGGASSTHAFVKTLFDAIITEDGSSVLEEVKADTYKAYFNGYTGISRIAQKISPYIEPEEFTQFCTDFPDATVISICDSFQRYIPDITPHNAGERLAELFQEIIKTAAASKRKSTSKGASSNVSQSHEKLGGKLLESGATIADGFSSVVEKLIEGSEDSVKTEAEVVDDDMPSGAATENAEPIKPGVQIIEKATIVNQYGENCVHIDHVDTFKL